MRLLYEKTLLANCECLLMEAGGAVVARVTFSADGLARCSNPDYPLNGRWRFEEQVLVLLGADGGTIARFDAEGLDERGRRLLWGAARAGGSWTRFALRELPAGASFPAISLCVSCKGRLHHLRQTLPRNLFDNLDYPRLELVVLDYNSTDGLREWMEANLGPYMDSGRVSYYRSRHPRFFNISHAKNLALRLAQGEILGIVDADNFTGKGYAYYLADNVREDNCLVGCRMAGEEFQPVDDEGCVGRFALRREAFYEIGGMNEELVGWGFEDIDFYSRLMLKGYRCQPLPHQYTTCIPHTDAERSRELEFPETGRGSAAGGTCFSNSLRSRENLSAGRIVSNAGRLGCGSVRDGRGETVLIRERRDPTLSLGIVCRPGEEALLRETLPRSLAALRYRPGAEVVVLSAGAGRPPAAFEREFAGGAGGPRLVHYHLDEPAGGPGVSPARLRNLCLRAAGGEILVSVAPGQVLETRFLALLLERHHRGGLRCLAGPAGLAVSRHLFALARGWREDLPEEAALADFETRIDRQWAADGGPESLAGQGRGFAPAFLWRGGELVPLGPPEPPRLSLVIPCCEPGVAALKETLPRNLRDNRFYPGLDVVILDCSGSGELGRFLRAELGGWLATRRLIHCRHHAGVGARPGLALNLGLRAAAGELLGTLDPASLTGRDYAFHLAQGLELSDFLTGFLQFGDQVDSDCEQPGGGRFALPRRIFELVGGFDERIAAAESLHRDFLERLAARSLRGAAIGGPFLERLPSRGAAPRVGPAGEKAAAPLDEGRGRRQAAVGAFDAAPP